MAKRVERAKTRNLLLARLPAAELAAVLARCDSVPLTRRFTMLERDQPIKHVFFPEGGVSSLTTSMKDGDTVEVLTVGREGMVGIELFMGGAVATVDGFVQVAGGTAHRMPADVFRREMDRKAAFYELLMRYSQALIGTIMQSTACNAVHSVEQRLSRWLLMAHDRMESDDFALTQEFAAMMLGATRPTVSLVAATLQKAGLITYHRGRVQVLDRPNLEAASCECYRATTNLLHAVISTRRVES